MALIRWAPASELATWREEVDRLFDESFFRPFRWASAFGDSYELPLDMYQTPEDVVVRASLPGVKPEEVEITITGDTLTIKGEHKAKEEVKREDYLCREHRYGSFSRSVSLPSHLRTDKAEAAFEDGVLTLRLPKAEEVKPRQIKVQARGVLEGKKA